MPDGLSQPSGITLSRKGNERMKQASVKKTVFIGMMGAVSAVLMLLNLSLPFAPGFLKFDISELPALFAGFFLGPLSGCGAVAVKILLKVLAQGSDTGYVGELMNVMGSICFILPASLIYRWKHTRQGAVIAMTVSTVLVSAAFIFINAYIAFPLYSKLYGMPMDAIISMGTAVNPLITDLPSLMLFSVFPFNLFKHGVTSFITYLIYKRVGSTLRGIMAVPEPQSRKMKERMEKAI